MYRIRDLRTFGSQRLGCRSTLSTTRVAIRLTVVLCALLTALADPSNLSAQADVPEIARVEFEGNVAFDDELLQRQIRTRPTQCKTTVLQPFCWMGFGFAKDRRFLNRRRTLPDDRSRLLAFYYLRGYRGAEVDTIVSDIGSQALPRVAVTFAIEENEPTVVDSLEIAWPEGDPLPELIGELRTQVGRPLDGLALSVDRDSIEIRLKNAGYAHAEVLRSYFVPRDARVAEVLFDIYPGRTARFGPVTVAGNVAVEDDVVLRLLPFEEGNGYRRRLLDEARRNLFGFDVFRTASVIADTTFVPDSVVPVNVVVSEDDLVRGRWGAGISTAECVSAEATVNFRNFLGGGRRLGVTARLSNFAAGQLNETPLCGDVGKGVFARRNWLLSMEFTQPWIFTPRHSFTATVFTERQSLKNVFVRRGVGATFAVNRSLGPGALASVSYRPQVVSLDAAELFFCISFLVCEPDDIRVLQDANWLSPAVLSVSANRTDQLLNPTRGWTAILELEAAGTELGSDFGYSRVIGDAAAYREFGPGWILATRIRAGVVGARAFRDPVGGATLEIVHPQKRFFAGGANTVRGFAQNQLGPRVLTEDVRNLLEDRIVGSDTVGAVCTLDGILNESCDATALNFSGALPSPTGGSAMLVANAELRFPIGGRSFQGAAFVDVGQVWPETSQFSAANLEWTPGFGVRYFSPIGPIRVDVGYRLAGAQDLQVVTQQLREFVPGQDDDSDRVIVGTEPVGYVRTNELAVLEPRVRFGDLPSLSFRRLQLHLSIGQAF